MKAYLRQSLSRGGLPTPDLLLAVPSIGQELSEESRLLHVKGLQRLLPQQHKPHFMDSVRLLFSRLSGRHMGKERLVQESSGKHRECAERLRRGADVFLLCS